MPLAGEDFNAVIHDAEYESVGLIDTNAPPSNQIMAKWFGSSDTLIAVTLNTLEQLVYAP